MEYAPRRNPPTLGLDRPARASVGGASPAHRRPRGASRRRHHRRRPPAGPLVGTRAQALRRISGGCSSVAADVLGANPDTRFVGEGERLRSMRCRPLGPCELGPPRRRGVCAGRRLRREPTGRRRHAGRGSPVLVPRVPDRGREPGPGPRAGVRVRALGGLCVQDRAAAGAEPRRPAARGVRSQIPARGGGALHVGRRGVGGERPHRVTARSAARGTPDGPHLGFLDLRLLLATQGGSAPRPSSPRASPPAASRSTA